MYRVETEINWDLIGGIMSLDVIKHFSLDMEIYWFHTGSIPSIAIDIMFDVFNFFNLKKP